MTTRATLKDVSTQVLEQLRAAIASGTVKPPVDRPTLVGFGIRHQSEPIEHALAGHKTAACLSVLEATLSEREIRRQTPELVWTGPEAPAGTARDTAVVLPELFESARESVILAGYSFDHAQDVPQIDRAGLEDEQLARHLGGFITDNWPFSYPRPRIFYDKRLLRPGPPYCSLHAKCVVVDGAKGVRLERELHPARPGTEHRGRRAHRGRDLRELPGGAVATVGGGGDWGESRVPVGSPAET